MKITPKMTKAVYLAAKEVYHNNKSKNDALNELEENYAMNKASASYYIDGFKKMMNGEEYQKTINAYATDYFLSYILSDYGVTQGINALKAVNAHVLYYENVTKANHKTLRSIISKYEKTLKLATAFEFPEEIEETIFEGAKKQITVNAYERSQIARDECIEHYGTVCVICDFDFEHVYGDIGTGFIHVHHLTPLAEIKEGYKLDPIAELRPVCPNCHAMLHKKKPPFSIEELQERIQNQYQNRIEFIPERDISELRGFLKGIDTTFSREDDRV